MQLLPPQQEPFRCELKTTVVSIDADRSTLKLVALHTCARSPDNRLKKPREKSRTFFIEVGIKLLLGVAVQRSQSGMLDWGLTREDFTDGLAEGILGLRM